jgi:hypothetical protein
MNSEAGVTKRMRLASALRAWLVIAAFITVVTTFNIFTAIHDAAEHGQALAAWEPTTWEYTSGIASLLCCGIIYWAVRNAPPARTAWPRLVAIHVAASFAFSSLHVVLMNAMRVAVYAAVGRHYQFGEAGFWYEYRKDLIAYLVWAAIFWFFTREPQRAPASNPRRTIDIQDGKRLLRVPIEEIAAIHAAGNYVEFALIDERRPLARESLSAAQQRLGDDFVRTHRSWAINLALVRGLRAAGAGDYEVELAGGLKAPLSRRFPEALDRIRRPTTFGSASGG